MSVKKKTKNAAQLSEVLGLSQADALEWELRYKITNKIIETTSKQELTVTELAKKSGTSRARITKILKGDSLGISLDVLVRVVASLGQNINLNFKKAS